jgi:hypothetical protein
VGAISVNREWFGDSYDIVNRFFINALHSLDYSAYVDPMPTGDWGSTEPVGGGFKLRRIGGQNCTLGPDPGRRLIG